jgi:hypothetical protein
VLLVVIAVMSRSYFELEDRAVHEHQEERREDREDR